MADEENDEPKKRGGLIKIIAMVLGGLLLVGAGVGAGYVLFGSFWDDEIVAINFC